MREVWWCLLASVLALFGHIVSLCTLLLPLLLRQVCVASVALLALGAGQREADVAAYEDRQVSDHYHIVSRK
jgi:hypothetical protein